MQILIKRGLSTNITSVNLAAGELAFTLDTGKLYIGNGETKILINPDFASGVSSVNGKDGDVTLVKADIGLGNVDNTADSNKVVASAARWTTARTLSLSGDGTASMSVTGAANASATLTLATTGVSPGTYPKVSVDAKGRVTAGSNLAIADIPSLPSSKITGLGTAATVNTGIASGNVPTVGSNGKLDASIIPAVAITDTEVFSSQAAMLAWAAAERGDVAIRTDLNTSFILLQTPASTLANWQELLTPESPVQSVNGMTGPVTISTITGNAGSATKLQTARTINGVVFNGTSNITVVDSTKEPALTAGTTAQYYRGDKTWSELAADVRATLLTGLGTLTNAAISATDTILQALAKLQGQINAKANLASPAFTGNPTAPTQAATNNSTRLATTAFVNAFVVDKGYLTSSSVIDGGEF